MSGTASQQQQQQRRQQQHCRQQHQHYNLALQIYAKTYSQKELVLL
jgi:hypothetical protein